MSIASVNPVRPARVVLVSGPSGSGKSTLAEGSGLPVLQLDDFYKDGDDPTIPTLPDGSGLDWDTPASWHAEQALDAIRRLCAEGRAEVPIYSIPANGKTGTQVLDLDGASVFVAEGIFAAEIVRACEAEGLLAAALCVRNRPVVTAWRRFRRDVREGRKSVPFLLRRGYRLMRAERAIVTYQVSRGAEPVTTAEARTRLAACSAETPIPAAV
ncbi:uridine kinase family protein [Streptacidiphilus monticola]|uniref:Uridine kinase n=1 Tax=Streptacidiphilus monticola TaxID=2161674 RepID=A0ABW1G7C1_9ACTN